MGTAWFVAKRSFISAGALSSKTLLAAGPRPKQLLRKKLLGSVANPTAPSGMYQRLARLGLLWVSASGDTVP